MCTSFQLQHRINSISYRGLLNHQNLLTDHLNKNHDQSELLTARQGELADERRELEHRRQTRAVHIQTNLMPFLQVRI